MRVSPRSSAFSAIRAWSTWLALERLEADVRDLRGELEELQNSSESGRSQQRDLYADLDKRLQTLEGARRPLRPPAPPASRRQAPPGPIRALRRRVRAAEGRPLRRGDHRASAVSGRFPESTLADNAQYWLGEAYYVTRTSSPPSRPSARSLTAGRIRASAGCAAEARLRRYEQKHWTHAREALLQVTRDPPTPPRRSRRAPRPHARKATSACSLSPSIPSPF